MTTGIFLGLSIMLLGIYLVLRIEWAGGLSERLLYTQTLSRQMDNYAVSII